MCLASQAKGRQTAHYPTYSFLKINAGMTRHKKGQNAGPKAPLLLTCTLPNSPSLSLSLIHEDQEAATALPAPGLRSSRLRNPAGCRPESRLPRARRGGGGGEAGSRGPEIRGGQAPGIAAGTTYPCFFSSMRRLLSGSRNAFVAEETIC
jgi:hypothetical protein